MKFHPIPLRMGSYQCRLNTYKIFHFLELVGLVTWLPAYLKPLSNQLTAWIDMWLIVLRIVVLAHNEPFDFVVSIFGWYVDDIEPSWLSASDVTLQVHPFQRCVDIGAKSATTTYTKCPIIRDHGLMSQKLSAWFELAQRGYMVRAYACLRCYGLVKARVEQTK